jgi:protein PsiE
MIMSSSSARVDRLGALLVEGFQHAALFLIGATIAWSAAQDYVLMLKAGRAGFDDILLLFIYLELGTMVGIYFKTDRLPVMLLLYIAITAMTRFMTVDIKSLPAGSILVVTASILVLSVAVLVLHFATVPAPSITRKEITSP